MQPSHKTTRRIFLFLLPFTLFLAAGCRKSTTPVVTPPPQPIGTDTTSHHFVWRIDTLGAGPNYSSLWDVAIIDENDVWVVGEIMMEDSYELDSLGNVIQPYNAAHWDGNEWELKRIFYFNYGQLNLIKPIRGILPQNNQEFWLAAGSIFYWNGGVASLSYLRNINTAEAVEKIWGDDQLYGAGTAGILVAYNGADWQELPTNTDRALTDIWGEEVNPGEPVLYATVSTENNDTDSKILKIENNTVTEVSSEGLPKDISGIWFDSDAGYYVVGDGIFYTPVLNDTSHWGELVPDITGYYTEAIAANNGKDIFIVGDFGTLIHFNGKSWKNFTDTNLPQFNGVLCSVDFRDDLVVAVGDLSVGGIPRAVIVMGTRVHL